MHQGQFFQNKNMFHGHPLFYTPATPG